MADSVQVALQMEEKKVHVRPSMESLTRSEITFVDPIRNKFQERPFRATSYPSPVVAPGIFIRVFRNSTTVLYKS